MILWMFACFSSGPVVQGVQDAATVTAKRQAQEVKATPENLVVTYQKPAGVYVDVRYFGGKSYNAVRPQLAEQLGALLNDTDIGIQGSELNFERGLLRVKEDNIYMLEIPLPEPLRRTEALGVLGFPPANQDYLNTTLEFRLNNVWGFRRLRFLKAERGGEECNKVQAWKSEP